MPGAEKNLARFRFYGALNDFLSGAGGATGPVVRYSFWGEPAIKDAIEAQGVPHPEVDLVLVNETPVPFGHSLTAGDRVSVYPWIQSLPLTRDVELLKRSPVQVGAFIRARAPRRQFREVVERCGLAECADPLTRCLDCNATLGLASPAAIDEQVPPRARAAHDEFVQCPSCDSVYWAGTHVERMMRLIKDVTGPTDEHSASNSRSHS